MWIGNQPAMTRNRTRFSTTVDNTQSMTDLTDLTLADARDGLKAKRFSSAELTQAHVGAIEKARELNVFVLETPERALEMAQASDARLATGNAGALEGLPLGIKDLFCTKGFQTTAGSNILKGFEPQYESTITQQLWREGAVMLGKLNNDEFAMGSSNETSAFGPVVSPWRRRGSNVHASEASGAIEGAHLVPGGSSGGAGAGGAGGVLWGGAGGAGRGAALPRRDGDRHRRLDPPARRLHRHRRHQADLRPLLALGRR